MRGTRRLVAGILIYPLSLSHGWSGEAQDIPPFTLAVGHGPGRIGLQISPNEDCQGPSAIAQADGGRLALLDSVNGKITVVNRKTGQVQDIALPRDFIEPEDFIATTKGYLVAGALGEVLALSSEGVVLARSMTEYKPENGRPRLVPQADGAFALEDLFATRIPIALPVAKTGTALVSGNAAAGSYTKQHISANEVALRSPNWGKALARITVTSALRVVDARPVWVQAGEGALIALQESRRFPTETAFVRLLSVDADGKPRGEAYLPPQAFACNTVRPFARLTDGRVVSLHYGAEGVLRIDPVRFSTPGSAPPIALGVSNDVSLIAEGDDQLSELERLNGTNSDSPIALMTITRATILKRALGPLELQWKMRASSYSHAGVANACDPPNNIWRRPRRLDNMLDQTVTAVPYRWGGYMPSLERFGKDLDNGLLAGDDCTCRKVNCIYRQATGMDCSGFVSYAWQTGRYYTTASLPKPHVSTAIDWTSIMPGDIVNKARNHVRLVAAMREGAQGRVITTIESSASKACGGICRRSYLQTQLQQNGYLPFRRNDLIEAEP